MELKKPTTFKEQTSLLSAKNIIVGNREDCENFLSHVNYYRFTAYFLPFLDRKTDKCFDGTYLERLKQIYYFDQELRTLIFGAIEDIEIHIRTQIAYFHAHKYGADGYMNRKNYNPKHDHAKFLSHVKDCIHENRKTLVVKHHQDKYDGNFPVWVIIEFFSVGMLSHFYRSLTTQDKKRIAKILYDTTPNNLESWLRCLTDLRNKCAHYSRLYYWIFPALPKIPNNDKHVPTRRLFSQLYMLKYMYPSKEKWNEHFVKPLIKLTKKYKPYISLNHLDFPYRWKSMLTK